MEINGQPLNNDSSSDTNKDIIAHFDNFVLETTENLEIADADLHDYILRFIATLSLADMYQLDKKYTYISDKSKIILYPKVHYVEKLQKRIYEAISRERFENRVLDATGYIASAPSRYIMYDRLVETIRNGIYSVTELIKYIEYGIEYYHFNLRTESMLMYAMDRVKLDCDWEYSDNGIIYHYTPPDNEFVNISIVLRANSSEEPYQCGVCYEDFPDSSSRVYLGDCIHSFCVNCSKSLLNREQVLCPMCRAVTSTLMCNTHETLALFGVSNDTTISESTHAENND
jgi:hypothetical protein